MILGLVCIASLMSAAFAKEGDILALSQGDKTFTISLSANPTTGYQWVLKQYDKNLFKLLSSHYEAPNSKLIGAGGKMNFIFSVNSQKHHPKSSSISLNYQRPWEPNNGSSKVIQIKFK